MTTKQGLISVGIAALSLSAITIEIVHERELRIKAEVTAEDGAKIIAANKQAMDERDKADAAQQQSAKIAAAAVATAPQAAKIIMQLVPVPATSGAAASTLPQAVVAQKPDLSAQVQAQLPNAASYVVTTQDQAVATAKKLIQCEADSTSLTACRLDKTTLTDSLKTETDVAASWETAAKGGTFWHRVGTGLKHATCGGSGGATGIGVTGMKGSTPTDGLIAGGSVFLGCEAVSWFAGRTKK